MTKEQKKVEISLPIEDFSFFKIFADKMGWSIDENTNKNNISIQKLIEQDTKEENPLKLNITLTNYYNIRKGRKNVYRHSISDNNCAQKIFRYNDGEICLNDKFKSIKKGWTYTDHHNGECPFIIRQYKSVLFICEALDKTLESEIDGDINIKLNKDSNKWYFEFKLGKVKK